MEVRDLVYQVLREYLDVTARMGFVDKTEEFDDDSILRDLGVDSMGVVEVTLMVEEKLGAEFEDLSLLQDVKTVGDLIRVVEEWL